MLNYKKDADTGTTSRLTGAEIRTRATAMPNRSLFATNLLCIANFAPGAGYAWDYIEGIWADLARLNTGRTIVVFPESDAGPTTLAATPCEIEKGDVSLATLRSILNLSRLIRRHRIESVYLTDRDTRHFAYIAFRAAGARTIVLHDHASGVRTQPRGLRRLLKSLLSALPLWNVDRVLAVSQFVANRLKQVNRFPTHRITVVRNGLVSTAMPASRSLRRMFGIPAERPIVFCACRAAPEKGVDILLKAFATLVLEVFPVKPVLVFVGDGPDRSRLEAIRRESGVAEDIIFAGYQENAAGLADEAELCVVPSVWQDALPLAVLEMMLRGKAIVASRVGGVPEMIIDDETGLLVPPADVAALTRAMRELLNSELLRHRMGEAARNRVRCHFDRGRQLELIADALCPGREQNGE